MSDVALETLLANAMAGHRCPVCSVLDAMVFDELCRLQREAVVDPATHADVVARGGYCADHFWYLDALASPVTNAELLAPLIDGAAERLVRLVADLATNPSMPPHGATQLRTRLGIPASCPVCDRIAVWQAAAIETLLAIIREPQRAEAYAHSSGLCLPHLLRALSTGVDQALADYLLRAALDQSRRLAADLRLYVRKWKDKDRRWGPENAAPRRAIEKLVGANAQRTRSG